MRAAAGRLGRVQAPWRCPRVVAGAPRRVSFLEPVFRVVRAMGFFEEDEQSHGQPQTLYFGEARANPHGQA